ncbi:pyridoxamine 5'-phosphate oxidase [Sulfurifustis variabilis]|uniref:Pyridoxamine 5'-phosphate oxidase n=1 Tax=Sulfurifustis variabilis TaxID=1675686 RepID=A0A1B4VAG6_9GAMM|nr:pyridoxamine 5'-phosphate oxidase family protein [Sulfurifustis variabilis]BAU46941.1 pyridoxamine 5'-phosphate oxidase [Sulfurifustis variabilis]
MTPEEQRTLARLLGASRWAALATSRDDEPFASWVAVAPEPDLARFLLHLSRLARHTRYLAVNPRAALAFTEPDSDPGRDPQTLARVTVQGTVAIVPRGSAEYAAERERYLARLPHAERTFALGDFELHRFVAESARYVPGFGRVHRLMPDDLRALARED